MKQSKNSGNQKVVMTLIQPSLIRVGTYRFDADRRSPDATWLSSGSTFSKRERSRPARDELKIAQHEVLGVGKQSEDEVP